MVNITEESERNSQVEKRRKKVGEVNNLCSVYNTNEQRINLGYIPGDFLFQETPTTTITGCTIFQLVWYLEGTSSQEAISNLTNITIQ